MSTVTLYLSVYWAVGTILLLVLFARDEGKITVASVIVALLGAFLWPLALLVFLVANAEEIVLWERRR